MLQPVAQIFRKIEIDPMVKTFIFKASKSRHSSVESSTSFIIKDYFFYQGMPFFKIKVIDREKAMNLFSEQATTRDPVLKKFDEKKTATTLIGARDHEQLKKLLLVNSRRIRLNDDENDGWYHESYLQILFNREVVDFNWQEHLEALLSIAKSAYQSYERESTCQECGKTRPEMKKCSKCKSVSYCNRECQRQNWKIHKLECGNNEEKLSDEDMWRSYEKVFTDLEQNYIHSAEEKLYSQFRNVYVNELLSGAQTDINRLVYKQCLDNYCIELEMLASLVY